MSFEVILIDYSWIYNKYYFVCKNKDFTFSNNAKDKHKEIQEVHCEALNDFFSRIRKAYPSSKVFVVLDSALSSTGLLSINKDYKQNRDKSQRNEVYKFFREITESLCNSHDFHFVKARGYEADYIIASLVKKYVNKVDNILIFSGDKDFFQLTYYPNVKISNKFEGGKFLVLSDLDIFSKFKNSKKEDFTRISTNKKDLLKYRVLRGDPSDNLPPVFPKIRDKDIIDIIHNYWTFEGITENLLDEIICSIKENNKTLGGKLEASRNNWITNYSLMNLFDVCIIKLTELKKHGN